MTEPTKDSVNLPPSTAMPPEIAKAVCAVMGDVPKLAKGDKNTHGNYNFASIDDFLEAVRPLCAKHGLIIIQDEESFDVREAANKDGKTTATWLMLRWRFTLAHSSGVVWERQFTRTSMVLAAMGAQAFGAAQSYALKQYMRSLFQIATGEKGEDADSHQQTELPATHAPADETAWTGALNKTALKTKLRALATDIDACDDHAQLLGLVNKDDDNGIARAGDAGFAEVVLRR